MIFMMKVAWRYMFSNIGQTLLLIVGVAIGAMAFVYITALINGLRDRQISLTTSNLAHITLEAPDRMPTERVDAKRGTEVLAAIQQDTASRPQIREYAGIIDLITKTKDVVAVSPEVHTSGFIVRAQKVQPVGINGLQVQHMDDITNLTASLVDGQAQLDGASALLGYDLAKNLGIGIGQTIRVRSDRQNEQLLTVRGIFSTGARFVDERTMYVNFDRARAFADLPYGITTINVRVRDLFQATDIAHRLGGITGLKSESWIESNARLADALNAQRRSSLLIQSFSMLTVLIGVASALLLNAYRRKAEIGIMRAMGITKGFIAGVFVIQGMLVGLLGSCVGAMAGFKLTSFLLTVGVRADGSPLLPLDPAQGKYGMLIAMVTGGAMLAALIPARMASKVDPVEAIGG